MIKLTDLILESTSGPKVVVMAGGAGAGKTYLLNQLNLSSLPQVNPDKYIEDPDHPAYNNLGQGARLADKEAEQLSDGGTSFVWDTTASNPKKIQDLINKNRWNWDKPVHLLGCSLAREFRYYVDNNINNIKSCDTSNPVVASMFNLKYNDDWGLNEKPSTKLADMLEAELDDTQREILDYNIKMFKKILKR